MPTAKREGSLMSRRYQLAAPDDDATLAQKRQYWRTKKREQRARLKGTRGRELDPQGSAVLNAKASPQPQVAVQGSPVAKAQPVAQISFRIQPLPPPPGMIHVSPDTPVFVQPEDRVVNSTPQTGTKRALIAARRAKGIDRPQPSAETEERAAKRREHWRIKKREQRAKLAARVKWREVTTGLALQRQAPQPTGLIDGAGLLGLAPMPLLRGDEECPGLTPLTSHRGKDRVKDEGPNGGSMAQASAAPDVSLRRKGASQRRLPAFADLSFPSGIAQYKTPRHRFAEAQRNLMSQRNTRRKAALHRSILKTEPNSTYEQIIAKQREYWRLKKREQRAKLSFKGKMWLKESYSKTIKLHHHIQEEKARLGIARIPVPETIGGFIKEDGTVTVNVPAQATEPRKEELDLCPENSLVLKPQQPDANWTSLVAVRENHAPPPFRPPRVKVSVKRPQCRRSVGSSNEPQRAGVSHLHSAAQAVGTFIINPLTPQNGGLKPGGCVLKMAVSGVASLAPSADAESTEKERIARKREYWRLKKREQRAACAARVKHSLLQARGVLARGVSEKRIAPEQLSLTVNQEGESQNGCFTDSGMQTEPHGSLVKEERESLDRYSPPTEANSDGIQLSSSPKPHPAPQPEPDLVLNPDMLTFQEEFPENVKSEIKAELGDEALDHEATPDFAVMVFGENEAFIHPHRKGESESSVTLSPFRSSCEDDLQLVSEHSFQNPLDDAEPSVGPSLEDQERGIFDQNESHQSSSSPEPPDLLQPPLDRLRRHQCQEADLCQITSSAAQRFCGIGTKQSGLSGLLKQREYWKLIKRQQRARLKARKSAPRGECSNLLSQALDLGPVLNPLPHQHNPLSSSPTTPFVNPSMCNGQPSDNLQVELPPTGSSFSLQTNTGLPQMNCEHFGSENQQEEATPLQDPEMYTNSETANNSHISILEPPPNPLCRISLGPTEPPPQTSDSSPVPAEIPYGQFQAAANTRSNRPAPVSTMVPPKHLPGEPEEEFLRRKREYWRIKKKEQRAKKAILDKGIALNRASTDMPTQDIQTQCVSSSEESDHLISTLLEADAGSFPCYTAPIEDESELVFAASDDGEDGPASSKTWRSCYLMDYDPLNHLLVCIVCGEMQYPPSLTRVRAHIDEAHPDSLTMPPMEKQQILDAWDEEVSRRERFFTSQLQRHSGVPEDDLMEDK